MNMLSPSALARLPAELSPQRPPASDKQITTHLIAVNCHPFHKTDDIQRCISTLIPEIVAFRRVVDGTVAVRVFWHRTDEPTPGIRLLMAASGLTLCRMPHHSSGQNLNTQIDYAIRCGYDIFFRVDADDTVKAVRFIEQAKFMSDTNCDICGCALQYQPAKGAGFVTRVSHKPGVRDFVENRFVLHPTVAARVQRLAEAGMRYCDKRLEDKEFFLDAMRHGLVIRNLDCVGGEYFLTSGARAALSMAWRGLMLNLQCVKETRAWWLAPYACLLALAHATVGPALLRRLRTVVPLRRIRHLSSETKQEDLSKI